PRDAEHRSSSVHELLSATDTPPPALYTLSLHDALPISDGLPDPHRSPVLQGRHHPRRDGPGHGPRGRLPTDRHPRQPRHRPLDLDRKSTRLNSSHVAISYAVFCLKKKKLLRR